MDWGLAALQASLAGGSIGDHLPPWSRPDAADPEEAMLATMQRLAARFPKSEE